jgi:DNA-binding SARP family transcriptional activator
MCVSEHGRAPSVVARSDAAYFRRRHHPPVAGESPGNHLEIVLRLLTFGSLSVHGTDGPLNGAAAQPRRLAILAIMARGGHRGAPRGKLMSLLWPDADEEQGRRVVTQALYALRRDLGRDNAILGTQDLRLNRDVVWSDVDEFDTALVEGDTARAVSVYVAPFLDGFRLATAPEFERWADDERGALQHRLFVALESLARGAEDRGALGEAVSWWRRRAAADPLNARVAIALMRALVAAGDRGGALRHAAIFEALVGEELGLPADREVIEMADTIRREATSAPSASMTATSTLVRAHDDTHDESTGAIAVLPFAILGPNRTPHDDLPWCDHLAEELIIALLGAGDVRVVARSASFALGPSPGLAALRGDLGVSHAIEGSVRRTTTGLRVNVRLIDVSLGTAVSWERFDCNATDLDAMPEQIAERFVERVRDLV